MHRICTIVAANYIPQALAFLESVRKFHPLVLCTVLVTDVLSVEHKLGEQTEFITTLDIGLDPLKIIAMESYYDQVEFATALKPYLLQYLLTLDARSVTYLDPDTQVYGSLDTIFDLGENYDAILTPHRLTPFGLNAKFYSERTFLEYGTYNLGFICVGQKSIKLLDWWRERLEFEATRYRNDSVFTDQKWANQFPAYFDPYIYKSPDINLAPWNLDERALNSRDGILRVGDIPLRMIHFSQMSSILAAGEQSDLWECTIDLLDENQEVLKLIRLITSEYQKRLMAFSGSNDLVVIIKKPPSKQLPSFCRDILRKRVMGKQKPLDSHWKVLLWFLSKLNLLERSDTFVSITRYLPSDVAKVLSIICFRKNASRISKD